MSTPEQIERAVVAQMELLGVEHEMFEIDPDFADTAAFCEKYGFPMGEVREHYRCGVEARAKEALRLHRRGDGPSGREQAGEGNDGGVAGVVRGRG